jgi:hypothetical protein
VKAMLETAVALLVVSCLSGSARAETASVALAGGVSSRGVGGEVVAGLTENLNLRGGLSGFRYSDSGNEDGIEYDRDWGLLTASVLLDWHMLHGGFRLSGGFILNKNKLDLDDEPTSLYEIGDATYTSAEVGDLTGRIDFNDVTAYLGIGWGNPVGKNKKRGFAVDLGVMFQGSANVKLTATGLLSTDSQFQEDLAMEEISVQDDLKNYKFYPVLGIAVTYKIR